ncbi:hypothetical protein K435DRAFT_813409 [Dendrothele bispora CBS 962.96]|uniref:Uncharacterized protein n=1 Tax=Dendrothele bispora (strain CBS 962.96) TaxID=1314807 RepID=A0A4S8KLJ1_DENBC|nr:hypothetical protein K435DRAFT_813409 [Dendrothele bispora CBS 962.96]
MSMPDLPTYLTWNHLLAASVAGSAYSNTNNATLIYGGRDQVEERESWDKEERGGSQKRRQKGKIGQTERTVPSPSHNVPIDPSLPHATSSNPTDLRPASTANRGRSNTALASSSTVEPLSKKRKLSMAESLQETITTSRQSILQAHSLKQKTRVEIEERRLAFEREKELNQQEAQRLELEDRKAAREHERTMMEASLELERLRRGISQ